jgi:hypothetical protein
MWDPIFWTSENFYLIGNRWKSNWWKLASRSERLFLHHQLFWLMLLFRSHLTANKTLTAFLSSNSYWICWSQMSDLSFYRYPKKYIIFWARFWLLLSITGLCCRQFESFFIVKLHNVICNLSTSNPSHPLSFVIQIRCVTSNRKVKVEKHGRN